MRSLLAGLSSLVLVGCGAEVVEVAACVETEPVRSPGDAADDAAIWVNRAMPERSLILGTDKRAGLHVYELSGEEVQFVPLGRANNVDLRHDFPFADGAAPIIAVSNRSDQTVNLLRLDEQAGRVVPEPVAAIATGLEEVYGVCLYHPAEGVFDVAATGTDGGVRQWRLVAEADGTVTASLVRSIRFASTTEGCLFDDRLQQLYVGEEDFGLWRLPAEPQGDDRVARTLVDRVWPFGRLRADVEGVALYAQDDATGFLVVSSQGDSTFRVYRREGDNAYIGGFRVSSCPDGGVDGVSHTDGLAVTSAPLGPDWPAGIVVVQDHTNRPAPHNQNFKLISWEDIASEIGL